MRVSLLSMWRHVAALRQQSRLLTVFILLFLVTYLFLSYRLFGSALHFIGRFPGVGSLVTEPLLFLLFAFLFLLLLISNLIIGYTNLFRNREATYLLTQPIPFATIFQWKLMESSLLASWAFLLLLVPFMAALGSHKHVAWHFYPISVAMLGLFVVLPGVAGCFTAVVVARFLDRRLFQVLAFLAVVAMLLAGGLWYRSGNAVEDPSGGRMTALVERLLRRTQFAQFPLLPSYWLTSALLRWAEGAFAAAGFFILVLLSNALFLTTVVCTRLGALFYRAATETQGRTSVFGRWVSSQNPARIEADFRVPWAEQALARVPGLRSEVRALILKDGRMFWRDTTQWVQTLMLFGLLAVYVFNIRYFSQQLTNPFWVYLVAFLNLGACNLNLATLTTRFVFPQFSLEGKRLWIVGMSPIGLVRVVWIKYWVATSLSLLLTLSLMAMSCISLGFNATHSFLFCLATFVMTLTLNALAVGLGALHPNFREDHPSKIVSGFGGTLCLILSFVYILSSVVILAMTVAWYPSHSPGPGQGIASALGFLGISAILGGVSMKMGLNQVRKLEV